MKAVARSQDNPNFIKMYHGNLEINVPRRLFRDGTANIIPSEEEAFRRTLRSRYPWLSRYALDEVMKGAREAMADHIERSKKAHERAREHLAHGRTRVALKILEDQLVDEPEDAEAWYAAAEVLFKLDRSEDAFRAMSRARSLSKTVSRKEP
ncbi:MAG: tetratricopeptide repeat protein [Methanomassiliicoccus sp.]|nr:tetratricopeptide repeat protein [Methanomassiliicoccus sp.]